jgi:hypothetical protein
MISSMTQTWKFWKHLAVGQQCRDAPDLKLVLSSDNGHFEHDGCHSLDTSLYSSSSCHHYSGTRHCTLLGPHLQGLGV